MRRKRSWKRESERRLSILKSDCRKYGRSEDLSWYAFPRNSVAATGSGMDVASILSSLAGGGVGGAVVMAIVGLIKAKMAKSS
jgi:hypothetical protein